MNGLGDNHASVNNDSCSLAFGTKHPFMTLNFPGEIAEMIETFKDMSIVLLPGVLISIVTATVTVNLSLRRFYSERFWERKMDVYSSIFDALYRLKRYYILKRDTETGKRVLPNGKLALLEHEWEDGDMELGKAIDVGSFLISGDAVQCLRDYRDRTRWTLDDADMEELVNQELGPLTDCIESLILIAHRDLESGKGRKSERRAKTE